MVHDMNYKDIVTAAILAAKGSGKSVMLASILKSFKKGVLIDTLGVYDPRKSHKTAVVPGSNYYESVEAFIHNHNKFKEQRHIIDFSEYFDEELIEKSDKLFEYIYTNLHDMPVLVDEVADIMPQMGLGSVWFHRLVKNGRNFGIRPVIFATQRPQGVNKTVLELCDTFFTSMHRGPRTIEYVMTILNDTGNKELGTMIRGLEKREFLKYDGGDIIKFKIPFYKWSFKQ